MYKYIFSAGSLKSAGNRKKKVKGDKPEFQKNTSEAAEVHNII